MGSFELERERVSLNYKIQKINIREVGGNFCRVLSILILPVSDKWRDELPTALKTVSTCNKQIY